MVINFAICAVAVLLAGFDSFFVVFLSFGFLVSIGFKEIYRKNDYLFYLNNGVSKLELLFFSYLLTFCSSVFIAFIVLLTNKLF
ncbi:hypothetical protein B0A81_05545 [Flavobacterium plurextorum]|uniref:Immunity protein n=1 Tax=Flavobacterium plurextorum TaxID=1114867 RepID=A0ABX4CYK1_9FLAO|nr:hypothetical protein B0A81_05545 [Flavobacterium plurextorum]